MGYIFEITWVVWFLSEILLNRLFQSKASKSKDLDKNSLRLIWITISVSIASCIFCSIYTKFPILHSGFVNLTGLVGIVLGILVRFIAIITLGKFFTVDLAVHDQHQLVNKGLYKYIRHPSYSGSLLSVFGFGLSFNNWICLLVMFVPVFLAFLNRMNIEENLLEQIEIGYDEYKRQTKRLLPYIY